MNGVGLPQIPGRVWRLQDIMVDDENISPEMETNIHKTIKK